MRRSKKLQGRGFLPPINENFKKENLKKEDKLKDILAKPKQGSGLKIFSSNKWKRFTS